MTHTCRTRPPRGAPAAPRIERDPAALGAHLEDAAHFPGGHAAGIALPRNEAEIASLLRSAGRVLPIGAQSSLTGGATPFGEVLIGTSRLAAILAADGTRVVAQAGATLDDVQAAARAHGAAFPPTPTFTGATVGGSVANNAAGAATFKYGSIRGWVEALSVVLACGEVLDLTRGSCLAADGRFVVETSGGPIEVPVPSYVMPPVQKRSAGYFAAPGMDLVDLFVGSEGTLGVIAEVTLRLLSPAPAVAMALVFCPDGDVGLELVAELRRESMRTWDARDPAGLDAFAVEHVDGRSLSLIRAHGDLADLHIQIPHGATLALLVQLELPPGTSSADAYDQVANASSPGGARTPLGRFCRLLERHGLLELTELAAPGEIQRQRDLIRFRESVPARVNALVGAAKRDVDARIEKTAADMIVPFERFGEMMAIYRRGFEERGLDFAVWGHISDGNVHPNVIPRTYDDVVRGKEAILQFGREAARLGGCPLAEHGVGRNPIKQALLRQLYGDEGIAQMRAVKRALDPEGRLAAGVIFGWESTEV